ncbi:hypothetical protein CC2G_014403 [Coprinopsis cinerea AmutBmut pab1-1]|nr:hypothetical protein CC2G_014403 [Coprinopsis cinerea AmutBmut pab1-1]
MGIGNVGSGDGLSGDRLYWVGRWVLFLKGCVLHSIKNLGFSGYSLVYPMQLAVVEQIRMSRPTDHQPLGQSMSGDENIHESAFNPSTLRHDLSSTSAGITVDCRDAVMEA